MFLLRLLFMIGILSAASVVSAQTPPRPAPTMHRYLIERTFPPGVLDKLDAATTAKIVANNTKAQVRWQSSYVNADKTRTFCIYEAPNPSAIRKAAALNGLPVDSITEIPGTLTPANH